MRPIAISIFIVIMFSVPPVTPSFGAYQQSPEEEFRIKKEVNRARIIDFYQRVLEDEKIETERRKGITATRKTRRDKLVQEEKARKYFIEHKVRPEPVDPSNWEREVKERRAEYERSRKDYVRRKATLDKLLQGLWKIPENEEFDLYAPQPESAMEQFE